jgi:serine/threonine-protein kinase
MQDDADLINRASQRAQALLDLHHPNIVSIRDARFEPDAVYFVTDIPEGESLEQRLAQHGPLEVDDALSIISQVAAALDYAHEQGTFHHDIRPANIILQDGTALLTDFFMLEALGATPAYAAPEQLDETSAGTPGSRSDAYALGVVVYEMLAGKPPFEGSAAEVALAHLTQRPLSPRLHNPDLFPSLDAILLKALSKQPQSRYQSAGSLANALREAVQAAQTRRMADEGVFGNSRTNADETSYNALTSITAGGVPLWIWIGLGILLTVVVSSAILLATN